MQFKDIIGQDQVKQRLIKMYHQNRLSHALLFLGKEGNGALSAAMAFTQYICCDRVNGKMPPPPKKEVSLFGDDSEVSENENQQFDLSDSCGICPSCLKASKLVHPDIHFSIPTISGLRTDRSTISNDLIVKWRSFILENPYGNTHDWLQFIEAENKQANITAAECEEIHRILSLKSFESEYKFLIMWMTELLGKEGNKLLKIIEEPPPNTIFIFVAENEQLILPTILSRTQLIKFPMLQTEEIKNALELKYNVDSNKSSLYAYLAKGNFREALHQLNHVEDDWEVTLRDWLNTIVKTGPMAQMKWVEEISKIGREKQKQFLQYFIYLLEQALTLRVRGNQALSQLEVSEKVSAEMDFASRFNRLCNIAQLEAIIQELDHSIYHIERNANAKILFHALTIKLYHIISNKSVILVA